MFELSGRVSSVDGDPARWQRYQDLRDGLLFTQGRVLQETADWNGSVTADNIGWRDQRFSGNYERIGAFRISGLWDEIPQFYSVDTRTPFSFPEDDGVLTLDDSAQAAGSHNAYLPIEVSPQFDLRESRKIGTFRVGATPTANLTSWAASRRRSTRASCRGGRASGSATTTRWRCPTGRAPTTWMSVWSGRTPGGCFAPPTTVRGSTTRPTR